MKPANLSKKMVGATFMLACGTLLAYNATISGDQWIGFAEYVGGLWLGVQGAVDISKIVKGK